MSPDSRPARSIWGAALLVAACAAVATAHGAYEVARAAGVPVPVAVLYPAITDGLALVAYATTTRLTAAGRRYAWAVVVTAAGLSGIAQATWLAGSVHTAPTWLRAGVGAWPAVAAAVVAHLLYLLATVGQSTTEAPTEDQPAAENQHVHPDDTRVQSAGCTPEPSSPVVEHRTAVEQARQALDVGVQPPTVPAASSPSPAAQRAPDHPSAETRTAKSARDRARARALAHRDRTDDLPTVSALAEAAQVSRGTAATALKALRTERPSLQIVAPTTPQRTDR